MMDSKRNDGMAKVCTTRHGFFLLRFHSTFAQNSRSNLLCPCKASSAMASRCDSSGEIGGREEKSMRRLSLAGRKRWRVLCCPALAGVLMVWASAYLGTFTTWMRFGKDIGLQQGTELEAWSAAVSTVMTDSDFPSCHPCHQRTIRDAFLIIEEPKEDLDEVGWGTRMGGVIVAGRPSLVCGVEFKANALKSSQVLPSFRFEANAAMVADGGAGCKAQLERAVMGGWHKGQVFYYRLGVDRPGHYTVRLSLVFYHNDERRADGIKLDLSDLMEVRLQCVVSTGRFVVPIKKISPTWEESIGVVEFDTVALDGEILLEIEGIYTCIGLSLVETFFHEEEQPHRVSSVIGEGDSKQSEGVEVDRGGGVDNSGRVSGKLAVLEEAWKRAGPVCARRYMEEATQRTSHQRGSVSRETVNQQRYFDEWARRERLEESCGRFCKPHNAPRFGEQGWTWAGRSERVQPEHDKKKAKWNPNFEEHDPAVKAIFQAAVEAGLREGVSPGTATALAAEAVDRVIKESEGSTLSPTATRQAVDRVARASKALVISRKYTANRKALPQDAATGKAAVDVEKEDGEEGRAPLQTESGDGDVNGQKKGWQGGKVETLVTTKKGSVAVGRITPPKGNPGRRLSVSADSGGALVEFTSIGERLDPRELELGQHLDIDEIDAGGSLRSGRRRMDAMGAPAGGGASSTVIVSKKTQQNPVDNSVEGGAPRGWRVDPSNPTPPPMCPSRLVELFEEALNVEAGKSGISGPMNISRSSEWSERVAGMDAIDRWLGGSQGSIIPTWLEWAFPSRGRVSDERLKQELAIRSLRSGFQAIAAYRAHDTAKGIEGNDELDAEDGGGASKRKDRTFPLRVTGFTWDGVTVVAKETVPGCARVARPTAPTVGPEGDWSSLSDVYDDDDPGFFWEEFENVDDLDAASSSSNMIEGDGSVEKREDVARGGKSPCLRVEEAMVPTVATVVDIIVPVSTGLVPRLLTLLPQMERLAKGTSCNPFPPSPQCPHSDHYAPAFWPERLTRRGHGHGQGERPPSESSSLYNAFAFASRNKTTAGLRAGARDGKGNWNNFRVVVSSDDSRVEAMLSDYDVNTVFVQSSAPFSKAKAIQDASQVIPDDHILLVHDADLFPPCGLPDALRQTVVRGVQAVNLLLPYENQPEVGRCMYPLSTFGPMAMYASDFRSAGGIAEANQGRWGYEDTAFLHKVMLGEKALGVLRVHLPGLVHRWHEVTPWKCMAWTWGGPPSARATSS